MNNILSICLISAICLFGVAQSQYGMFAPFTMGASVVDYRGLGEDVYGLNADGSIVKYDHFTSTTSSIGGNAAYKIGTAGTSLYAIQNNNRSILNEYQPETGTWSVAYSNAAVTIAFLADGGNYIAFSDTNNFIYRNTGGNTWASVPKLPGLTELPTSNWACCGATCLVISSSGRVYTNDVRNYPNWRFSYIGAGTIWDRVYCGDNETPYARNSTSGELYQFSGTIASGSWSGLGLPGAVTGNNNYAITKTGIYASTPNPYQGLFKRMTGWFVLSAGPNGGGGVMYGPYLSYSPVTVSSGNGLGFVFSV